MWSRGSGDIRNINNNFDTVKVCLLCSLQLNVIIST